MEHFQVFFFPYSFEVMQVQQQQKVPITYLKETVLEQDYFLITVLWTGLINFDIISFKAKHKYT